MPAIITDTSIVLQPDNVGYQAFRIPLEPQPAGAVTMVFYFKGYVNGLDSNQTEDGANYGWNNDSFFGLSFNGNVAANTGGIVGWTNSTSNRVLGAAGRSSSHPLFAGQYGSATPFYFGDTISFFYYGHPTLTTSANLSNAAYCFPTTDVIGVAEAEKFLGIFRISRHDTNAQNIVLSFGANWENRSMEDFSGALSAAATRWVFSNHTVAETTNFRPGGAMSFPGWIVGKWPSGVIGRTLTLSALRVEYYNGVL